MTASLRPTLTGLPVLETERLILRGPQASDWPIFRDFTMSDRAIFVGGPKNEAEAAQKFAGFFGHWVLRGFGRLIAMDRTTGQPIGHFGPMQWADDAELELTWSLWTADAEGKGYATEGAKAMKAWVFSALGVTSARAEVHSDNAASHRIALALGGALREGEKPAWFDAGSVYGFTAGAA